MKSQSIPVFILFGALSLCSAQITITNGASYDATQPIAPGSFATAFGQGLCSATAIGTWVAPGQLPMMLGGCSVTVNGSAAMMQYVSPGQINFIMPAGIGPGSAAVIINNGSQTLPATMMAGAAGPGMFAANGMGMGEGAMLNGTTWQMGPFSTSTNGGATYVSIYVTGLDPSATPTVTIGGMPVNVKWFGDAPGYAGLQQINIALPDGMAGVGRVPVMVTSNGQTSNVTFMHVLPTTAMMQGMPGWGQGMMVNDNMPRGHEMSALAFNSANNTALVTDENDDVVRVISIASKSTLATITLPSGSVAHGIAINADGSLGAVTLSAKAAVAILDLKQNKIVSVTGTGYYPSHAAFAGSNLLVTNSASGTVSVIDSSTGTTLQTVNTGLGASGIAVAGNAAIIANMQAGSVSLMNLTNYSVTTIALPAGSRPFDVAASAQANKAVIAMPMSNALVLLDLATKATTQIATTTWNGMGPRTVAIAGTTIYAANQMSATVTAIDMNAGTALKTFTVDPGPVALAATSSSVLVLAEGTGTLDMIDPSSYTITARINAGDTERQGQFTMPLISSFTPATAAAGTNLTLTITGSGFQGVTGLGFYLTSGTPGGMMGGGMGPGMGQQDSNIKVSNVQVNASGTQITASVAIGAAATSGTRQIRLQTSYGQIMGMMTAGSLFNVTK